MLKMDMEYKNQIFFIRLSGDLNKMSSRKINNYVIPVLKKYNLKKVIINLNRLNNIDSSGLNAILNVKCTTSNNHGKLYFCEGSDSLVRFLKVLHIKWIPRENLAKKKLEV